MKPPEGPARIQNINKYVDIREDPISKNALMVHIPTDIIIKKYAAVVGLEEGAWTAMVEYAERAIELNAVDWSTDDSDFLFPAGGDFVSKYLDPVGFGEKTAEDVSAELMEKIMRRFQK